MKHPEIKGLVFDFYGVIYSNFDWTVVDERIYSDPLKRAEFRKHIKLANIGEIGNEALLNIGAKLAEDEEHPSSPAVLEIPSINFEVVGLIKSLSRRFKVGLLSNGSREHIRSVLDEYRLRDSFKVIMTSAESGAPKPNAQAFLSMLDALGLQQDELLFIDDSPRHIAGARKAGFAAIQFQDIEDLRNDLMAYRVLNEED